MNNGFIEVEYDVVDRRTLKGKINETIKENTCEYRGIIIDFIHYWILIQLKVKNSEQRRKIIEYLKIQLKPYRDSINNERKVLLFFRDNIEVINNYDEAMLILNELDALMVVRYEEHEKIFASYENLLMDDMVEAYQYRNLTKGIGLLNEEDTKRCHQKIMKL